MNNGQNQQGGAAGGVSIRTILNINGEARIVFKLPDDITLLFDPDAAAEIALNLLSACYAARGEQALYTYAMDNGIDPATLIKRERSL